MAESGVTDAAQTQVRGPKATRVGGRRVRAAHRRKVSSTEPLEQLKIRKIRVAYSVDVPREAGDGKRFNIDAAWVDREDIPDTPLTLAPDEYIRCRGEANVYGPFAQSDIVYPAYFDVESDGMHKSVVKLFKDPSEAEKARKKGAAVAYPVDPVTIS